MLFQNVVVSEWRCVGMALCQNGDMSGYVLLGMFFTVTNSLTIHVTHLMSIVIDFQGNKLTD